MKVIVPITIFVYWWKDCPQKPFYTSFNRIDGARIIDFIDYLYRNGLEYSMIKKDVEVETEGWLSSV